MKSRKSQCNNNKIDETTTERYFFRYSLERDIAKVSVASFFLKADWFVASEGARALVIWTDASVSKSNHISNKPVLTCLLV